ncbi:MAG TPA: nuclear transport factor 2 family protein [Candidatus Sulfotelmatobacter sp.]|nr:nuclear transport factor 2 family protein [Candidatus Sulfotelmatobacter sp.]
MKTKLVAVAVLLLSFATTAAAQQKPQAIKSETMPRQLEAQVRKLWEAFKNKDKATLSALLDDGFRRFEEGLTTFGDKKAEVSSVDEFELISYKLSDFTVKSTAPNTALVTYIAQYEGKTGGEVSKAKSVFGEVWIRTGNEWKALYMQETYIK